MPELKNPRWEKFCQLYVTLGNASEAYRKAGYRNTTISAVTSDSSRLLTYDDIKTRIRDIRAQQVFNQSMTREELAGYYTAAIKTPASEIPINHPLVQSYEVGKNGVKLRIPDKNVAAAGLARLHGWEAAQRVELTTDNPLTVYLRALRGDAMTDRYDSEPNTPNPLITNDGVSNT